MKSETNAELERLLENASDPTDSFTTRRRNWPTRIQVDRKRAEWAWAQGSRPGARTLARARFQGCASFLTKDDPRPA